MHRAFNKLLHSTSSRSSQPFHWVCVRIQTHCSLSFDSALINIVAVLAARKRRFCCLRGHLWARTELLGAPQCLCFLWMPLVASAIAVCGPGSVCSAIPDGVALCLPIQGKRRKQSHQNCSYIELPHASALNTPQQIPCAIHCQAPAASVRPAAPQDCLSAQHRSGGLHMCAASSTRCAGVA